MTKREMVIEYVRNNPGQTSGEIGRALKLTPSSATAQLCLLTQLGVLVRERNSEGLYCYRHSDSVEPDTDTAADTTAVEPQQPVTAKTNSGAIQSGHPASSSSHKAVFDEFPQLAGDPLFADVKPNGKSVAPAAMPKAAIGTEDWDNEIIALGEMDAYLNGVPDLFAKRRILNYLAQKHRVEGVIA